MATHDYVIANQTGANTRSDLNNLFSAIVSQNSSGSEPATKYAYMVWADTGNDLLKVRNASNNAWISLYTLSTGAPVTASASALPKAGGTMTGNIVMSDDTSIGIADNAERIEFDGAGDISVLGAKLGIGTTTPNRMLTVEGDGNEPDISLVQLDNTNNNFNEIRFLSVGSDDSTRRVGASFKGIYTTHNAENPTTDLSFETRNAGGTLAERLRIDSEGTITVATNAVGTMTTDNDGSFSMSASNNFKCTPTGNFTLTFTNIVAQSGNILLVNSGGHTVSAHANTKVDANLLSTVSTAGTYLLSYFSDGTNVYMTNSAIYT